MGQHAVENRVASTSYCSPLDYLYALDSREQCAKNLSVVFPQATPFVLSDKLKFVGHLTELHRQILGGLCEKGRLRLCGKPISLLRFSGFLNLQA